MRAVVLLLAAALVVGLSASAEGRESGKVRAHSVDRTKAPDKKSSVDEQRQSVDQSTPRIDQIIPDICKGCS